MNCPRCGAELREVEPNASWLRHWVCEECFSAWHLEDGVLQLGKKDNFELDALRRLGARPVTEETE